MSPPFAPPRSGGGHREKLSFGSQFIKLEVDIHTEQVLTWHTICTVVDTLRLVT